MRIQTKHTFLSAFFILILSSAWCQSDYVVSIKGDTLFGKVKYLNYGTEKSVQVASPNKKKKVFPILQTRAFSFQGEVYHPVRTIQGYYTYMKLIKAGYLSLYGFQMPEQTGFDGRYLVKRDGSALEVPNLGFKKQMTKFLGDCDGMTEKFEAKEFSKSDLIEIVDSYNQCMQSKTENVKKELAVVDSKLTLWNTLEQELNKAGDFEGKSTALEMIAEVKTKIERNEKIPGFLTEGLKSSLQQQPALLEMLQTALATMK
jgi:ribosomal protein S17E